MTKFALFDFDDTLARGDSVVPYLLYCIRRGVAPWTQLFRAVRGYVHQRLHPEEIAAAKTIALSFLRGQTRQRMDDLARDFFRDVLTKRFYQEGVAELQRLRQEGYTVVVISASVEPKPTPRGPLPMERFISMRTSSHMAPSSINTA